MSNILSDSCSLSGSIWMIWFVLQCFACGPPFLVVEKKGNELEQLRMDCEHYKARLEAAQADCVRERKVKEDSYSLPSLYI